MRYAPWLGVLGVIGVVYGAFVAYAQKDMKRLVAYSSVSHLGLVVIGIGAFTTIVALRARSSRWSTTASRRARSSSSSASSTSAATRARSPPTAASRASCPVTTALFVIATLSSIGLPGLNGFVGEFLILARDLDLAAPLVGGRGGDGRHPLGDLHALARPAGLLEPARARGEPDAQGHPAERARRRRDPRRPDGLDRRPAQRRPRPVCGASRRGRCQETVGRQAASRAGAGHDAELRPRSRRPTSSRSRRRSCSPRPGCLDPPARGLRAAAAPLVRDARAGRRSPARSTSSLARPVGHDVRRPLRDLGADRSSSGLFLGASRRPRDPRRQALPRARRARRRASSTRCSSGDTSASRS